MPKYAINRSTLPALERDVYAFKRRADLVLLALDHKLDTRLSNYWRDFYIDLYNALDPVNYLTFLISEKAFPGSHYQAGWPKRVDAKYFEREFKKIAERKEALYKAAHELDELIKSDSAILANLRPDLTWQDWLDYLEEISYHIDYTKEIFLSIK